MTMSDVLITGIAIGIALGVLLDRVVLLSLARDLVKHGWR
jgi:F0F1-type ATP synthase assembly protein I